MSGCTTCGGFGMHHDPVAHGRDQPECTCTELDRLTVCHDMRNEPHLVGCSRWGTPRYDQGGVVPISYFREADQRRRTS